MDKYKPFKKNCSASELNIDKNRKFIFIEHTTHRFKYGDILTLERDDNTEAPSFISQDGKFGYCSWHRLAYYDDALVKAQKMLQMLLQT